MPPDRTQGAPSVWVQLVLYRHHRADVDRFLSGLEASVAVAQRKGAVGAVALTVGDCSPEPVLSSEEVAAVRERLRASGLDRFEYRFFDANLGSAAGNNALMTECDRDLILILNPDTYASPDLLVELSVVLADPDVGIAEGRQVPLEHPKDFDRETGETSWSSMACALVRATVARAVGGFDPDSFFLYCDDVDISWRVRLSGAKVVYRPTATVFHDKRLDLAGQVEAGGAEHYYSAEAALMMAWKYSRPDLAEEWSEGLLGTGAEHYVRTVATFRRRRDDGTLPAPLDPEATVAQFVRGEYAVHRFAYDD